MKPMEPHATMEILSGRSAGEPVALARDRYLIGRTTTADIRLDDPAVSRRHAELSRDSVGKWWIRDLRSAVGTYVNGAAVTSAELHGGEQIRLGGTLLRFHSGIDGGAATTHVASRLELRSEPTHSVSSLKELRPPQLSFASLRGLEALGVQLGGMQSTLGRYELLCSKVADLLGPNLVVRVLRVDGDAPGDSVEALCERDASAGGARVDHISRGVLRRLSMTREPLMASNMPQAGVEAPVSMFEAPLIVLAAPLGRTDRSQDLLYITSSRPDLANAECLALATLAAAQCRQADLTWRIHERLRQQELMETDLRRAREIQSRLVPPPIALPGLDCAFAVQPCRWVGGDYLDIPVCTPERLVICIGDVSGKGMPAALLTGNLHAIFRTAPPDGADLLSQLRRANTYFCEHLPGDAFITLLAVELAPSTGELRYACAGHLGPVLVSAGVARWLDTPRCPPLGVEAVQPVLAQHMLAPGDWLVLMTDGLIEAADEQRVLFGDERLLRTLGEVARSQPNDAASFLRALWSTLDTFQGTAESADDRTCLVLRRSSSARP